MWNMQKIKSMIFKVQHLRLLKLYVPNANVQSQPRGAVDKCCNKTLLTYAASRGDTLQTFDVLPYIKRNLRSACITNISLSLKL